MPELLTAKQLAEKAGISPTNLRKLLRKDFNRAGKTKVEGNRQEYRFASNDPIVKQIMEKAKTLTEEKGKPKKNKISNREVHRMLTDKLHILEQEIAQSRGATYYLLSVKTGYLNDLIPVKRKITLDYFFKKHLPKLD